MSRFSYFLKFLKRSKFCLFGTKPCVSLSAPLATLAIGSGSEVERDGSESDHYEVNQPKGKFLWCLDDSYGYTKGRAVCY